MTTATIPDLAEYTSHRHDEGRGLTWTERYRSRCVGIIRKWTEAGKAGWNFRTSLCASGKGTSMSR